MKEAMIQQKTSSLLTVLATKPLNGMNKAVMKLGSPSQTRHLWSYILPHGPTPPTTTHLQNPTGYPRRPFLSSSKQCFANWALLQNPYLLQFLPPLVCLLKRSCSFLLFFFQSCRECLGIKEQFAQGTQRLKTKLHTCRLVSAWFLTKKGDREVLRKRDGSLRKKGETGV
jgi:hypothetical protein